MGTETEVDGTVMAKKGHGTTTAAPSSAASSSWIKDLLGYVLLPLVVFLYSSGIPQMRDIMKNGDTQGYSFMPFLFLQINAFIWTVYAFHFGIMGMLQPALGNAWGLLVNTAYLIVFAMNMKDAEVKAKFMKCVGILESAFILIAIVSWIPGAQSCGDPNSMYCWTGKLVVVVNCFLFTGAFDAFGLVWRTKSVEFFPILTPCLGFIASFDCIFYFTLQNDINGLIPNVIGDCLNLSQIIFYLYVNANFEQTWKTKKVAENTLADPMLGA